MIMQTYQYFNQIYFQLNQEMNVMRCRQKFLILLNLLKYFRKNWIALYLFFDFALNQALQQKNICLLVFLCNFYLSKPLPVLFVSGLWQNDFLVGSFCVFFCGQFFFVNSYLSLTCVLWFIGQLSPGSRPRLKSIGGSLSSFLM